MDILDSGGATQIASAKPAPALHLEEFERSNFNVDSYVKRVAAESVYASSIVEAKERLQRVAAQTAEEIKNSVFRNYANIMETSREVGHLEGKMTQLRQSLDEQRKLLAMLKMWSQQANTVLVASATSTQSQQQSRPKSAQPTAAASTSLSLILEQVEGCGLIISPLQQQPKAGSVQQTTNGRTLLYHSDLDSLHIDNYSVSHRTHGYLLNDGILIAIPQRRRSSSAVLLAQQHHSNPKTKSSGSKASVEFLAPATATLPTSSTSSYLYKFQAFYELQDIKIINIEDSKEVRNAFQLLKFPQSLAFRCPNAHIKKGSPIWK